MKSDASEYLLPSSDDGPGPSSLEAERGLLGCVLLAPGSSAESINRCLERFGTDEVFYDLRNALVWSAMTYLHSKGQPVEVITLMEELKSRSQLEQVGFEYLSTLPDGQFSVENLPTYVGIVWEKFFFRKLVEKNRMEIATVVEHNGAAESFVARIDENHQRIKKLLERGAVSPKNLCKPGDFGEAYYDVWFKHKEDSYGWELPFKFPMRIRPHEMTLFTGDNGSGKSSMLGMISIVAGKQFLAGEKVVVASMEVPPEITLWIMARQLLGVGKLECTEQNITRIARALEWLNKRVLIYNFLGITDWRELLNTFRYAREHCQGTVFIVDSVMRIGIPDDDYAMQGVVAAQFADFCVKTGAHTFLVVHENKGEGRQKDKVRGSKQWTDNAHNVCAVKRNEQKAEKVEEWKSEVRAQEMTDEEFRENMNKVSKVWDTKFILSKQRWPGSQQNASRWLYFDHQSLQFHEQPGQGSYDFML